MGVIETLIEADVAKRPATRNTKPPVAESIERAGPAEPCLCGGRIFWQDGYDRVHCDRCKPPPTESLVVRRWRLGTPQAAEDGPCEPEGHVPWFLTHCDPEGDEELTSAEIGGPCPKCNSLAKWESIIGTWRCLKCEPPVAAERLLAKRARILSHFKKSA